MRWDRVRRMRGEELRWRARTTLRAAAQDLASRVRTPRWNRSDITAVLTPAAGRDIRDDAAAGRWPGVHAALARRMQARRTRFVLDPAAQRHVCHAVLAHDPDAGNQARARADRVVKGRYDLLGYRGLRFTTSGRRVDWHFDPVWGRSAPRVFHARVPYLDPAIGDHKIIWELNRHQHWLTLGRAAWLTGDHRYADAALDELYDWLDANPPLIGINWASMLEIGFRAISWTWTLHWLLGLSGPDAGTAWPGARSGDTPGRIPDQDRGSRTGDARPWLVDMLVALARQLTHVERNLSYYFSPNTHLTGEALALYVAGVALPELAAADRWIGTGRRVLLAEIDRQILADGGHAERSTHYQRYTLEFYVLALLTARIAGDDEAAARFEEAARRLAEFTRVLADDKGRLPLIGDDDGGMLWPLTGRACNDVRDALATAAAALGRPALAPWGPTEETIWVAGPAAAARLAEGERPAPAPIASRALADTGYIVMRDAGGSHAVFDAAPHGYLNAGHAHADALAVTLTLAGRPLLVDPGTSTYTMDPALRDRLRSTASHNTLTIDGQPQSTPAGPFHWLTRTDATLETWRGHETLDYAEAAHEGYAPVRHRRAVVRTARGGWLIADEILGRGRRTAAAHWHVAPEWTLRSEAGRVQAVHADGAGAWLLHDGGSAAIVCADRESGLGWYAPVYGMLQPSSTVRITLEGEAPLYMLTWVAGDAAWPSPVLHRVAVDGDADPSTLAAAVASGGRRALFLLRMGGAPAHAARICRAAEFESDARLLHALSDGDRLISIDLVDATRLVTRRRGWLSIDAEGPFGDLHVSVDAGVVDLRASAPTAALRVSGLAPSHRLRLNGRDFMSAWPAGDAVLVLPSDWQHATPEPRLPGVLVT